MLLRIVIKRYSEDWMRRIDQVSKGKACMGGKEEGKGKRDTRERERGEREGEESLTLCHTGPTLSFPHRSIHTLYPAKRKALPNRHTLTMHAPNMTEFQFLKSEQLSNYTSVSFTTYTKKAITLPSYWKRIIHLCELIICSNRTTWKPSTCDWCLVIAMMRIIYGFAVGIADKSRLWVLTNWSW